MGDKVASQNHERTCDGHAPGDLSSGARKAETSTSSSSSQRSSGLSSRMSSRSEVNMGKLKRSLRRKALLHKDSLKHHLQDYCSSTSIHGVKYLGNTTTPLEKAWWAAMLACCVVGNAYLIHKVWVKWNHSPVIVSFAETAMPVWEVPFPTITICSSIKSDVESFNFTKHFNQMMNNKKNGDNITTNISERDFQSMSDMSLICDEPILVEGAEDFVNESAIEFLMDVGPELNETSLVCQFDDEAITNCSDYFTKTFLDEGVCYSFNMLSPTQLFDQSHGSNPYFEEHFYDSSWSLGKGYASDSDLQSSYPRRVLSAGARSSMSVVLQYRSRDFDSLCRGPIGGFKVLLNNPAEFPLSRELYWRSPPGEELILMVQPKIMTTSDGLRPYDPKIRQCYFQGERYLHYFQVYTQRNCEVECLTNFTLNECGCVAFYMPRKPSTPLCGAAKKSCMIDAQSALRTYEIEAVRKESINSKCNCLQACQSIQFDAETSQSQLDAVKVLTAFGDNASEIDGLEVARVKIFFKDKQFIPSRRSELFGVVDFLANCGGLLGLFCGISILSICELVYYITIRFWSNFKVVKKKHESMEKDDGTATSAVSNNDLRAELKMY
uniref:Sodium channel protein Nach n=1 Tax=Lygus hesperus TaxID=30085 RepID=A0A0A9XCD9_LYGHE